MLLNNLPQVPQYEYVNITLPDDQDMVYHAIEISKPVAPLQVIKDIGIHSYFS